MIATTAAPARPASDTVPPAGVRDEAGRTPGRGPFKSSPNSTTPASVWGSSADGRVVVGVHGSHGSLAALDWAAALAAARGWELDVVTAWPEPEEVFVHDVPGHFCQPRSRAAAELEAALARIEQVVATVPRVVSHLLNAPVTVALMAACDDDCVLVVGASHVHEAAKPWVRGVDEVCSLHAPCTVVIVDSPQDAEAG